MTPREQDNARTCAAIDEFAERMKSVVHNSEFLLKSLENMNAKLAEHADALRIENAELKRKLNEQLVAQ